MARRRRWGELARLEIQAGPGDGCPDAHRTGAGGIRSLRINVTSPKLRASFFASVRKVHELGVTC